MNDAYDAFDFGSLNYCELDLVLDESFETPAPTTGVTADIDWSVDDTIVEDARDTLVLFPTAKSTLPWQAPRRDQESRRLRSEEVTRCEHGKLNLCRENVRDGEPSIRRAVSIAPPTTPSSAQLHSTANVSIEDMIQESLAEYETAPIAPNAWALWVHRL